MKIAHKVAEYLACCWRISGDDSIIPVKDGIFDRAIEKLVKSQSFPVWMNDFWTFWDSPRGRRCCELDDVWYWGVAGCLVRPVEYQANGDWFNLKVAISENCAMRFLDSMAEFVDQAREVGRKLREAVEQEKRNAES